MSFKDIVCLDPLSLPLPQSWLPWGKPLAPLLPPRQPWCCAFPTGPETMELAGYACNIWNSPRRYPFPKVTVNSEIRRRKTSSIILNQIWSKLLISYWPVATDQDGFWSGPLHGIPGWVALRHVLQGLLNMATVFFHMAWFFVQELRFPTFQEVTWSLAGRASRLTSCLRVSASICCSGRKLTNMDGKRCKDYGQEIRNCIGFYFGFWS